MGRLLLVSNRLPVTVRIAGGEVTVQPSTGGLASGLAGTHQARESLWLGWPGETSKLPTQKLGALNKQLKRLRALPLYLSASEVARFYDGFCNRVIWPLFHYLVDRIPLFTRDWGVYERVNQRFADLVMEHYQPGDVIWVHDYQLMLVPGMLRAQLKSARIGFFLHIPFPSPEVFRVLPWRREVLLGLLGADVVGFHTDAYAKHFAESLTDLLGTRGHHQVHWDGRDVQIGAFPMGVDAPAFAERANSPETATLVEEIRDQSKGQRLLLGVDRLDYTKGIRRRLIAVERLLAREPSLRGKLRFVQVAVPSRTHVETYATFRREVDEQVGRINGKYGTPSSMPIHYLYRSIPPAQLSALYRSAEVMVVTPLRDGMNLVAKEFIASRTDGDGVLVLSEFAGAAAELPEALLVNPYDVDGMAATLGRALELAPAERRWRMAALRKRVSGHTVHHWAESFLDKLGQAAESKPCTKPLPFSPPSEIGRLSRQLVNAPARRLFLDYDGTLVPIVASPELAAPTRRVRELLLRLAQFPETQVHVVSGRPRGELETWLGDLPIALHAEHGLWTRASPESKWRAALSPDLAWMQPVQEFLEAEAKEIAGSRVEMKSGAIAFHYRNVSASQVESALAELVPALKKGIEGTGGRLVQGRKVLELRPRGVHKGLVVTEALKFSRGPEVIFAAGDDVTDEDLFEALPVDGIAVHVGRLPSSARFRVESPDALLEILEQCLPPTASEPQHLH